MRAIPIRSRAVAAFVAASLVAVAGCGSSGNENTETKVSSAALKTQVDEICQQATREIDGLPDPLDTDTAAKVQTSTAQIFKTAVGKLNELNTDVGLPASYKSWLAEFEQLPALNEKAAASFTQEGILSGQAMEAGAAWDSQAKKANALADKAGLTDCLYGPGRSN